MEDFRIIVRANSEGAQIANLITATGQVRDAIGAPGAIKMLQALREEIRFCERYILNADSNAPTSTRNVVCQNQWPNV